MILVVIAIAVLGGIGIMKSKEEKVDPDEEEKKI